MLYCTKKYQNEKRKEDENNNCFIRFGWNNYRFWSGDYEFGSVCVEENWNGVCFRGGVASFYRTTVENTVYGILWCFC